eukprot:11509849-Karenia_brevis.AAC.1
MDLPANKHQSITGNILRREQSPGYTSTFPRRSSNQWPVQQKVPVGTGPIQKNGCWSKVRSLLATGQVARP